MQNRRNDKNQSELDRLMTIATRVVEAQLRQFGYTIIVLTMTTSAGSALALPAAPRDELRQAVDCAGTWLLYAPLPELIWGRALQWRSSLGLRQTTRGSKTARKAGLTILQKELAI